MTTIRLAWAAPNFSAVKGIIHAQELCTIGSSKRTRNFASASLKIMPLETARFRDSLNTPKLDSPLTLTSDFSGSCDAFADLDGSAEVPDLGDAVDAGHSLSDAHDPALPRGNS